MFGLFHSSDIPAFSHITVRSKDDQKKNQPKLRVHTLVYSVSVASCVTDLPAAAHSDAVLGSSTAHTLLIVMIKMKPSLFALCD